MKQISFILILVAITIVSCSKSDKILLNQNFDEGNWLLVNVNYAEKKLSLIDDEKVLKENTSKLYVSANGECGGTTCDGFLRLYKNGKLVAEKAYLMSDKVHESSEIRESYESGEEFTIEPTDQNDFKVKWDSLIKENNYPTIYNSQPQDKDIIWVFKKTAANTR
jgi:hypothetical protein